MSTTTCVICNKKYFDFQRHTCGTRYECREHESDDERTFYSHADNLGKVAEEFSNHVFYDWDCPDELDIEVRRPDSDEWHRFLITVEPVPTFQYQEYEKYTCIDCGVEFESTKWKPERCRKHELEHDQMQYEKWKAEYEAEKALPK